MNIYDRRLIDITHLQPTTQTDLHSTVMEDEKKHHSSKHKRHSRKGEEGEHRSKKRHRHDKEDRPKRKRHDKHVEVIDEDPDGEMWIEKNIDMDGEDVSDNFEPVLMFFGPDCYSSP